MVILNRGTTVGFHKQTVRNLPLHHGSPVRVLVRVDYNVPMADGVIGDDFRIRASLPTLRFLLDQGCSLVLISHLGRPVGRESKYSLEPTARRLEELLAKKVLFVDDTVGDIAFQAVKKASRGSIVMLQNLRFDPREEQNNEAFAKGLARVSQADYFVQDGFGVVHRAHSSTSAITHELPSVAGLLVEKEVTSIQNAMEKPKRPLVAVLGGAKVSDKIQVVERLVKIADTVLIGGAMANTFLQYKGMHIGRSKVEENQKSTLDDIYSSAEKKAENKVDDFIVLPKDIAVANEITATEKRKNRLVEHIHNDEINVDIGEKTIEEYTSIIAKAGTVIWNGPMGITEIKQFSHGSARIALTIATNSDITSIVGGGDTADFVLGWDARQGGSFSHVSTGGGASLDLMAGKDLPGIESLLDAR